MYTTASNLFSLNCIADYFSGFVCWVLHAFQWKDGVLTDLGSLSGNDGKQQ